MDDFNYDILFLAPLPPPSNGQSLISEKLLNKFSHKFTIKSLDISENSNNLGRWEIKRVFSTLILLVKIAYFSSKSNIIYLTISESLLGNIKDLIIYLIIYKKLKNTIIHLHGGTIGVKIFEKFSFIYKINKFFYKKLSSIVILGESHRKIFPKNLDNKIRIVPNYVSDSMRINETDFQIKLINDKKIVVSFISSMIKEKGYRKLLSAYFQLSKLEQSQIILNFAGAFRSNKEEEQFSQDIKGYENISFHGVVKSEDKKTLFHKTHIFVLPTQLLEGQPLAILEAYASGCCVLTTKKPGINDIFKDHINGFFIEDDHSLSLHYLLKMILKSRQLIKSISRNNLNISKNKYSENSFIENFSKILYR